MYQPDALSLNHSPAVLLDIDNTLINSVSQLNVPLLSALRAYGLTNVILFSSYDVFYRLRVSVMSAVTRLDVIRRLKHEGFTVQAVLVSATPYSGETGLGDYYRDRIEPLERCAKQHFIDTGESTREALLKTSAGSEFAKNEIELIERWGKQAWGGVAPWLEEQYRGGKQHLLTYAVQRLHESGRGQHFFMVFDDKPEVLNVVRRADAEKTYGPEVRLFAFPVTFTQTSMEETCEHYSAQLQRAYTALQLPLPVLKSPVSLQRGACIDTTGALCVDNLMPAWIKDYADIFLRGNHTQTWLEKYPEHATHPRIHLLSLQEAPDIVSYLEEATEIVVSDSHFTYDFHFLGLPTAQKLTYLQQEFSHRPYQLALIEGYRLVLKTHAICQQVATSSWHAGYFSMPHEKRAKLYAHLLASPEALLKKLFLIKGILENKKDEKLQELLKPLLANFPLSLEAGPFKTLVEQAPCPIDSAVYDRHQRRIIELVTQQESSAIKEWCDLPTTPTLAYQLGGAS